MKLDDVLESLETKYPDKLNGLLPRIYAGSNLDAISQESKDFTYRLCRMNLFIHGLDANIQLGNSYFDDKHATRKADYVLANPTVRVRGWR